MDSGSEIDFNDIPEYDSDASDNEQAKRKESKAGAGQSRDSSLSRSEEVSRRSASPVSKAEEVGHRSESSPSEEEEKSSSTESSGPKVDTEDSTDSEVDAKDELEVDEPLKPESRKVSEVKAASEAVESQRQRSVSPEASPSPREVSPAPREASPTPREASPAPREASPAPREESPAPKEASPSPRAESPAPRDDSPAPRDDSPASREASVSPTPTARVESPERKSSQGSSSYDERERASSMSPEPTEAISVPSFAAKPSPATPSSQKDITRIYTDQLVNEKPAESFADKIGRTKPMGGDITQIYTASIQQQKEQQSPRLERARGGKPVKDITQLYTANLNKPEPTTPELVGSPNRPRRNENITKLYTNGFEQAKSNFKAKPSDEITNPRKHNMATSADKDGIRDAYNKVMDDHSNTNWAVFKFDESNCLVVSGTGEEVSEFKSQFGPDDKGFGYVKVQTGDEMSKRSRFVLVTWMGANISVMKKAKMSTDKLVVKEIIQNLSVEIQTENSHELSPEYLKAEVDKAGGARYGTGVRVE